jgi:hypothetical protein
VLGMIAGFSFVGFRFCVNTVYNHLRMPIEPLKSQALFAEGSLI